MHNILSFDTEWWNSALKFMHEHTANVFFKDDSVVFEWHSGEYICLVESGTLFDAVKEALETEDKMVEVKEDQEDQYLDQEG